MKTMKWIWKNNELVADREAMKNNEKQ